MYGRTDRSASISKRYYFLIYAECFKYNFIVLTILVNLFSAIFFHITIIISNICLVAVFPGVDIVYIYFIFSLGWFFTVLLIF